MDNVIQHIASAKPSDELIPINTSTTQPRQQEYVQPLYFTCFLGLPWGEQGAERDTSLHLAACANFLLMGGGCASVVKMLNYRLFRPHYRLMHVMVQPALEK